MMGGRRRRRRANLGAEKKEFMEGEGSSKVFAALRRVPIVDRRHVMAA